MKIFEVSSAARSLVLVAYSLILIAAGAAPASGASWSDLADLVSQPPRGGTLAVGPGTGIFRINTVVAAMPGSDGRRRVRFGVDGDIGPLEVSASSFAFSEGAGGPAVGAYADSAGVSVVTADGDGWDREVVGGGGGGLQAGPVAVSTDPARDAVVLFTEEGSTDRRLVGSFRTARGLFGPPVVVADPAPLAAPSVAVASPGRAVVAWRTGSGLAVVRGTSAGFSSPTLVDTGAVTDGPQVIEDATGAAHVAWEEAGSLAIASVDTAGMVSAPARMSALGRDFRLLADSAGDVLVGWVDPYGVLVAAVRAKGATTWQTTAVGPALDASPAIDLAPDGTGIAAATDGAGMVIARVLDVGRRAASQSVVTCTARGMPVAASAGNGGEVAVVVDRPGFGRWGFSRLLDPNGPQRPSQECGIPGGPIEDPNAISGPSSGPPYAQITAHAGHLDRRGRLVTTVGLSDGARVELTGSLRVAGRRLTVRPLTVSAARAQVRSLALAVRGGRPRLRIRRANIEARLLNPVGSGHHPWPTTTTASVASLASGRGRVLRGGPRADRLRGHGGDDVLVGRGGDDRLDGWSGADTLLGDAGADRLLGATGPDRLDGGTGDDMLSGDENGDLLAGDAGDDVLDGGPDGDVVFGGRDADRVLGGTGGDILDGGAGDDSVDGGPGADVLFGGSGNDLLSGGGVADHLYGGPGDDELVGGTGADDLEGGDGNDVIIAGADGDTIYAGAGNDTIYGGNAYCGPGDDTWYIPPYDTEPAGARGCEHIIPSALGAPTPHDPIVTLPTGGMTTGTDGPDLINGRGGPDHIDGLAGDDVIWGDAFPGESAPDVVVGDVGNDTIYGGAGNDVLSGGPGNDYLEGNSGNDRIDGGPGDDEIRGDQGNDRITAGPGNDRVHVLGGGHDTVDCGAGADTVQADPRDRLRNCEHIER